MISPVVPHSDDAYSHSATPTATSWPGSSWGGGVFGDTLDHPELEFTLRIPKILGEGPLFTMPLAGGKLLWRQPTEMVPVPDSDPVILGHEDANGEAGLAGDASSATSRGLSVPARLLRGSIAGSLAKLCVYPCDRVKMIYQVKGSTVGPFRLRLLFRELRTIARNEGVLKLWKGNLSAVARTFPHSGIVFFCFDSYHERLQTYTSMSPLFTRFLAGGCAGVTATFFTYPLDVWNTRMAVSRSNFTYRQVSLLQHEGLISLYRGLLPTLIGIFPYSAVSFFTFESLKHRAVKRRRTQAAIDVLNASATSLAPTPAQLMLFGGIAGAASQTLTYPLDTIRKVMQSNTFLHRYQETGSIGASHPTIASTIKHIYSTRGLRGFYVGVTLNWLKGSVAGGLAFSIHEAMKRTFSSQ